MTPEVYPADAGLAMEAMATRSQMTIDASTASDVRSHGILDEPDGLAGILNPASIFLRPWMENIRLCKI